MNDERLNVRRLVEKGYDLLGPRYSQWTLANDPRYRLDYLALLLGLLPEGSSVLELGCGSGDTVGKAIAERHRYVGIDLSQQQLSLAKLNVPDGSFIRADMSEVEFRPESFDAVVAFYSIFHVPRETHPELLARISRWLPPGGFLVATLGALDNPGMTEPWIDGVEMFWSSYDAAANLRLLEEAGFSLVRDEVLVNFEDNAEVRFLWVVARKDLPVGPRG